MYRHMTIKLFLVPILTIKLACLSTHHISHDKSGYDQMNTRLKGERAIITLYNDEEYVGYETAIGTDSTTGVEIRRSGGREIERNPWRISTSDIKMIEIKDQLRGGSIGFGVGFALGAVTGALLGAAAAGLNDEEPEFSHYIAGAGIVGLAGGVVFGITGLIIGYKDKYVFTHAEQKE